MKLIFFFFGLIGVVCFYLAGFSLLKQRKLNQVGEFEIPFADLSSFKIEKETKYKFYFSYKSSYALKHFRIPKIEIVHSDGKICYPRSFLNFHSSNLDEASYLIGGCYLPAGEYSLKVPLEDFEAYKKYEGAKVLVSTSSIVTLLAAIFSFIFPSIAFVFLILVTLERLFV